jgi:CRP-like cAMP-binding protein
MSIAPFLKSSVLFKDWPDSDIGALASLCTKRHLAPGETLFDEGEISKALYLLLSGTMSIKKASSQGDQAVTNIGGHSHFGEMGMLTSEGQPEKRSATASAVEPSEIVEIGYDAIRQILSKSPAAGCAFYRNLATNLAGRIRKTTEDLAGLRALRLRQL